MNPNEFDQTLLASLKRLGLYIPPAEPASAAQLAVHNAAVAKEQARAQRLTEDVETLRTTIAATIAPAVMPTHIEVARMVEWAERLHVDIPPALMDITDDEPRAVDAAGVVLPVAHGAPLASVTRTGVQLDDGLYLVEHDEKTGRYRFDLYTNGNGMFKPGKTENSAGRDFCNVHNARADVTRMGDATLRMTTRMWLERPTRAK